MRWKHWAGYYAVCSYDSCHELEYFAFRHAAGLMDVTPLYKYVVQGPDAGRLLARIMSKDVRKLKQGRVSYLCWCDEDGFVLDDGTVTRLEEHKYFVTAAEPSLAWFHKHARRMDVQIEEVTDQMGALAIQGPASRNVLGDATDGDDSVEKLGFFRSTDSVLGGKRVRITRTGYTGDLGYEVWCDAADGVVVWDAIMAAGRAHRLQPAGLDALDVTRVEAGFIMNGVDYFSANHCSIPDRKSTPSEVGLGWTVKLDRDPFIGQQALFAEKERGPKWGLAGIAMDWDELEALFSARDLPPSLPAGAWRTSVPVYDGAGSQVGYATSGAWSPVLKKNLALCTLKAPYATEGNRLRIEITVEHERKTVGASVVPMPFFNPERKRWTP